MAIGCTFLGVQFARLCTKQAELTEISLEILKIHSEVHSELQEIKKLREELNIIAEVTSNDNFVYREKRSIPDSDKGNMAPINKSKASKQSKKKNSTIKRSPKQNTLFDLYNHLPPKTQTSSASHGTFFLVSSLTFNNY